MQLTDMHLEENNFSFVRKLMANAIEMLNKIAICIILSFFSSSAWSSAYWFSKTWISMQLNNENEVNEADNDNGSEIAEDLTNEDENLAFPETNRTTGVEDPVSENNFEDSNKTEKSTEFMETTKVELPVTSAEPIIEAEDVTIPNNPNINITNSSSSTLPQIEEKIVLPRSNCNLEIPVHRSNDIKAQIKFEPIKNNSHGKCWITLNGHNDVLLGILISDIHLYRNRFGGELLKVIVHNYFADFTLKKYYGKSDYQPLLLTETNKVYIVLHYHATQVAANEEYSHFNLEVFNYNEYENNIYNYENTNYRNYQPYSDDYVPRMESNSNIFFRL